MIGMNLAGEVKMREYRRMVERVNREAWKLEGLDLRDRRRNRAALLDRQ